MPGTVRVHVHDRVDPDDIVAEAPVSGGMQLVDVAHALGVDTDVAMRSIRVTAGQKVAKGDLLAKTLRLTARRRQVSSPATGVVQGVHDSCVLIRQGPELLSLRAHLPGEVTERYPHRGVAIRTYGSLVRGIWGHGGERKGVLATMTEGPADLLTWEHVGLRYRGTIMVGGMLEDPRVLYRAQQFRLNGLVLGSMLPGLRPLCERLALPVLITEGIGRVPMAEPVFRLLFGHHGRPAMLSGSVTDGLSSPELVIPGAEVQSATAAVPRQIEAGASVRLTRPPFLGELAQVLTVYDAPQRTAIGTEADGADVRLPTGPRIFVPYANMELMG